MPYRNTGIRGPSGTLEKPENRDPRKTGKLEPETLAGPYEIRKTETLVGPYKNGKTEAWDLTKIGKPGPGILARPYKNWKTETRDLNGTLEIV